jgi:copper chaperone
MLQLSVPDMACGACKAAVEKALAPLVAPSSLTIDMAARQVRCDGPVDAGQIIAALARIGFAARPL